jgi:hypothetical protein
MTAYLLAALDMAGTTQVPSLAGQAREWLRAPRGSIPRRVSMGAQ